MNYFIKEINKLMSKQHKKAWTVLNYIEHFLILASAVTGFISIYGFAFLLSSPVGIASSAVGLKICSITTLIKRYKSMIKKKKKKHDKIVLLAK